MTTPLDYQGSRMFPQNILDDLDRRLAALETSAQPCGEDAANGAIVEREAIPENCDVRKILLRVVPGDGSGHEVYAKDIADVEQMLSEMGERLENFELARAALAAEKVAQAEPEWIMKLRQELMLSKMTHNFTFSRDEVMALLAAPPAQTQVALTVMQRQAIELAITYMKQNAYNERSGHIQGLRALLLARKRAGE